MDKENEKFVPKHDKPKKKSKKEKTIDLDQATGKKPKKKRNFFKRIRAKFAAMPSLKRKIVITIISIIAVLVILLGTVLGYGCAVYCGIKSSYNYNDIDDGELNAIKPIDEGIVNIALFGIDSRKVGSFKGLSDSIMIISLNKKTDQVKLISVMRDTFVEIPGYNPGKINSAYSLGGPALGIKTLNQNFGLDIKEYATVNFYGMAEIVDAVGGIEVNVRREELNNSKGLNNNIREQCKYLGVDANDYIVKEPGLQKLGGIQAVAWARIRAVSTDVSGEGNDYGRTDRQRYVLEQLLNEVKGLEFTQMASLAQEIVKHMETSLHFEKELIPLITAMFSNNISFSQTRVPQSEYVISDKYSYAGSGWSVYYNLDFAGDIIHSFIYKDITQEDYLKNQGIILDGWHSSGSLGGSGSNNSGSNNYVPNNNSTSSSSYVSSSSGSSKPASTSSNTMSSNITSSNITSSNITSSVKDPSNITSSESTSSAESSSENVSSEIVSSSNSSSAESSSGTTSSSNSSSAVSSSNGGLTDNDPSDSPSEEPSTDETSSEISSSVVSSIDAPSDDMSSTVSSSSGASSTDTSSIDTPSTDSPSKEESSVSSVFEESVE